MVSYMSSWASNTLIDYENSKMIKFKFNPLTICPKDVEVSPPEHVDVPADVLAGDEGAEGHQGMDGQEDVARNEDEAEDGAGEGVEVSHGGKIGLKGDVRSLTLLVCASL